MPYELTESTLTTTFLLIWAFIGLTMLRDQLLTVRRQRLEQSGIQPALKISKPKGTKIRRPRTTPTLLDRQGV